ncbi:MAG: hypothetical protein H7Z19_08460, partial [Chitinophagaceae bacterium]|nr:hypothetical protein [Rubrivivax sp.]
MNANKAFEPAAAGHPGQLARAVDQLLEAADWNEFDSTFRVGGGDIQAIVDANIVRLFMNPAGETRHLDVFELSTKRPDAQDYLTTFTAAAGEFMFLCKELKISGETRQLWKNPARIAPVHAEEMLLAIQHAARDARTFFDKEGVEAKARVEIEKLQAELPQFTKLNDDKQLQRVTEVTAALGRLFGPLLQLERYTSLLKSGDLAALAGHSLSTEQVLRPPYDLVEPWATALLHHKQHAPRTSKTPPSVAAANDARALVQVLLLNETARMAGGKLRFVLISTDEGLHAVFKDFFDKGKVQGAPDRAAYVMRRPLQFGPMFNLRDMPNGFSERQPFERLKKSLQSAQKTVASSEGKVPLDASTISGIRDDWDSAMRTASVICSALAVRRFEALFRQLCSIRPGPEGIGALVALQERMLGQFEAGYLALDVQGLLANVAAAQERGSRAPGL